jgi:phosphoribosylanthranilate isomerase
VPSEERVKVTEVKICGITNQEDASFAANCGAAALGFIFYPLSPRYIKPANAEQITGGLPDKTVRVGVFVNADPEEINKIVERCGLDMIQLHGDESPDYCSQFPASMVIKAIELKNEQDLNNALNYNVTALLIDCRHAGLYGGTGRKANWDLACRIKNTKPLILSGGLKKDNIVEALRSVAPAALDINSGVETSPGRKDHEKLARIFDIIRAADTAPEISPLIFSKRIL